MSSINNMPDHDCFMHKKTKALYHVISTDVINATNQSEDHEMVLYMNTRGQMFTREKQEFFDGRFEPVIHESLD